MLYWWKSTSWAQQDGVLLQGLTKLAYVREHVPGPTHVWDWWSHLDIGAGMEIFPCFISFHHLFPTPLKCFATHPPPFWFQNISADVWCLVPPFRRDLPDISARWQLDLFVVARVLPSVVGPRSRSSSSARVVVTWPPIYGQIFLLPKVVGLRAGDLCRSEHNPMVNQLEYESANAIGCWVW